MNKLANKATKIAVIGLSCYYPGARTPLELWENILARRQQFRSMPDVRLPASGYWDSNPLTPDKSYLSKAAVIDGYEYDWLAKRTPQKTYESTDIVHWLALDTALAALADAGYNAERLPRATSGVIVGNTLTGEFTRAEYMRMRWPYIQRVLRASAQEKGITGSQLAALETTMEAYYKSVFAPITEDTLAGGLANTIAGRICNYLDIHGGGYVVDGACASSLLAIKTAATYLENREMDVVITGGVDISLDAFEMIGFSKTGALTREQMNVYDKKARGFIPGEGCGMVVLKRLEDAERDGDYIYALLKGWGVSSDGKGGITAPKDEGQALALHRAYEKASFDPHQLDFIEGHGTGTSVGDKTELSAITLALNHYGTAKPRQCGMTSFKSVVGHTKAAAGIGAFIKTVIALNQRVIPPTAGCTDPHEIFSKEAIALYPVLLGEVKSPEATMQAGVSAMGFGGINCHVVLESAHAPATKLTPGLDVRKLMVSSQSSELFLLTASSTDELIKQINSCIEDLHGISDAEFADYAAYLNRKINYTYKIRLALVAADSEELRRKLTALRATPLQLSLQPGEIRAEMEGSVLLSRQPSVGRVGVLFPGQGSQQLNMTRVLTERYDWARALVKKAKQLFAARGYDDIISYMYRPLDRAANAQETNQWKDALKQTDIAQPAIVLSSLLWYTFLRKLDIPVAAVAGHSLGELMSFYAAGAYDEETLLQLAALRGKAMASENSGTMASLSCSRQQAEELLTQVQGYAVIANLNSPLQIIISGENEAVAHAVALAQAQGITTHQLPVSAAFHSKLIAPAATQLKNLSALQKPMPGTLTKVISAMTGKEVEEGTPLNEYFAAQALSEVDFISTAWTMKNHCNLLLEVGPGKVLSTLVGHIAANTTCLPVESKAGKDTDLNLLLANLFTRGIDINCDPLYEGRLIRPFVRASERKFLVSPLEKPFKNLPVSTTSNGHLPDFAGFDQLSLHPEQLQQYLLKRGDFIQTVIKADMMSLASLSGSLQAIPAVSPVSPVTATREAIKSVIISTSARETVYSMLSEKTGFPASSLNNNLRLLDDLNMDSIKAGALIADAAGALNLHGKLEPVQMANATIGEVIAYFDNYLAQHPAPALHTSHELVYKTISEKTGFPASSLNHNLRLLDDLNMDSIKAGALIADAAGALNLHGKLEPVQMANATIGEVIAYFDQYLHPQKAAPVTASLPKAKQATLPLEQNRWTRSMTARVMVSPLPFGQKSPPDIKAERVVIVHSPAGAIQAQAFAAALGEHGISNRLVTYNKLKAYPLESHHHLVALLDGEYETAPVTALAHISNTIEELAAVATSSFFTGRLCYQKSFTIIQQGDGKFNKAPGKQALLPGDSAAAFAASLHLEIPGLKIRVMEFDLPASRWIHPWLHELSAADYYIAAGYDAALNRATIVHDVVFPVQEAKRPVQLTAGDVVLVTGGAKGITAECALRMAEKWGCKMALIGSSPLACPGSSSDQEVMTTLKRYADKGLTASYYSCDISCREALAQVLGEISQQLGTISVVVHGAGVNKARRTSQVSAEEARREIAPKVSGGLHLMELLEGKGLKLFVAFTSIIGVAGMPGNAWYAFSNETLDLQLRAFAGRNPGLETLSLAYSVWDDVGMGVKMGSTHHLGKMGIEAVPSKEGVDAFLKWIEHKPTDQQVVITSRYNNLGEWQIVGDRVLCTRSVLDTFKRSYHLLPSAKRYIETIVLYAPDIESLTETHLTLEKDTYIKDHVYNGSYLFPTVFGLEAMAQQVAWLTGAPLAGGVTISDIHLDQPIVVSKDRGTTIRIHALREEPTPDQPMPVVSVAIYTEQTGFEVAHFSAKFILATPEQVSARWTEPTAVTPINPKTDLYGGLLFQGEQFHRIASVYDISDKEVRFNTQVSPEDTTSYLLGDPFYRDSLLQSGQLLIPHLSCLPVYIDRIHIMQPVHLNDRHRNVTTRLTSIADHTIHTEVAVFDQQGQCCEVIGDYRTRVLKPLYEGATPGDLVHPGRRDLELIARAWKKAAESFGLSADPGFATGYDRSFASTDKEQRHLAELPLIRAALGNLYGQCDADSLRISWHPGGKPKVTGIGREAHISLSHTGNLCVAVAAPLAVGVDVESLTANTATNPAGLVGSKGAACFRLLTGQGEAEHKAAIRVWTAMEAVIKTGVRSIDTLNYSGQSGEAVYFTCESGNQTLDVVTFPLLLTLGSERMFAVALCQQPFVAPPPVRAVQVPVSQPPAVTDFVEGINEEGKYAMRFRTTFKDCRSLSGKSYFTSFPLWMGIIRELALHPVGRQLVRDLGSGEWGIVTNDSGIRIVGELNALDLVEGRMWVARESDYDASYMALGFEWLKVEPDGRFTPVATAYLNTTWVRILDHGKVQVVPLPGYFADFLATLPLPTGTEHPADEMPFVSPHDAGELVYQSPAGPRPEIMLLSRTFQTGLDDGNAVGNLYYSNYYSFQARIRDMFFYQASPALFKGKGEQGELICVETNVKHLQEAMPFESIEVLMYLDKLYEKGLSLYFEYFCTGENGHRRKLAYGTHTAIWVNRANEQAAPVATALPEVLIHALYVYVPIRN